MPVSALATPTRHPGRRPCAPAALVTGLVLAALPPPPSAHASDWLEFDLQTSPDLRTWTDHPADSLPRAEDGSLLVPSDGATTYVRGRLTPAPAGTSLHTIELEKLDPTVVARARAFLAAATAPRPDAPSPADEEWDDQTELAPMAYLIFDPAVLGGTEPAYVEIKLLRPPHPDSSGRPAPRNDGAARDAGSIILALTEDDHPVTSFATEGPGEVERLHRLAGTPALRPVRFGGGFLVGEDPTGRPLAITGTPIPLLPVYAEPALRETIAVDGDERSLPPAPPTWDLLGQPRGFETYDDLKTHYLTSPLYQRLREDRRRSLEGVWQVERGILPAAVTIPQGSSTELPYAGTPATPVTWLLDDESTPGFVDIRINFDREGNHVGLVIFGRELGRGLLTVILPDDTRHHHSLLVTPRTGSAPNALAATLAPAVGLPEYFVTDWYAGTWSKQPRYGQVWNEQYFCAYSGCGPTAWSIVWGWLERERGIRFLFHPSATSSAPSGHSDSGSLYLTQKSLHEDCDTWCVPGWSDAAATYPGDMVEGGFTQAWPFMVVNFLTGPWSYGYDWPGNGFDEGARAARRGVQRGVPSLVGVGFYSHYVVAYGYRLRELVQEGYVIQRWRFFKCNWGHANENPRWHNGHDTFYGQHFDFEQTLP